MFTRPVKTCILLIAHFTIALVKCSVPLYSIFYLLISIHKITFDFPCTCYLLDTLKRGSNYRTDEALQVLLLFLYATRKRADFTTLFINSLTNNFTKSILNTLLRDYT